MEETTVGEAELHTEANSEAEKQVEVEEPEAGVFGIWVQRVKSSRCGVQGLWGDLRFRLHVGTTEKQNKNKVIYISIVRLLIRFVFN